MSNNQFQATNLTAEDKDYLEKYADKLSPTTKSSKWIHSTSEHEDHPGQALVTRDHQVIQNWAKERGGAPATVLGTEHNDHLGVLRFNFPGFGGQNLEEVSWDQWFKTFDDRQLAFIFQEKMDDGKPSNFFQLDSPYREHA